MASSIHVKKASAGAVAHNSRETFSQSVVFTDEKNELWNDKKEAFSMYREELAIRSQAYSERTGQSLQKNAITHLSAVVNLEQHHTLDDVQKIAKHIEQKFDTKVFQIAVHRDEGKLVSKADDKLVYTSGTDFFKCPKTNELFWDKKYTQKINLEEYTIVKNYHAHIEFMGLTSTGEAVKRNYMSKRNLSQLQTFVAKELGMERGKNYYETKERAPRRLDVHEYKRVNAIQRSAIEGAVKDIRAELATVKDVNLQYKLEREKMKQSGTATQKDYQELKKQYKELEEQAKNKDLTIAKLTSYQKAFDYVAKELQIPKNEAGKYEASAVKSTVETIKSERAATQNLKLEYHHSIATSQKALEIEREETKKLKEQVSTLENENVSLRANVSELEQEKEELKQEVSKLQAIVDKVSSFFSCRTSDLIDKVTSFFAKKSEPLSSSSPLERSDIERSAAAPSLARPGEDLFVDDENAQYEVEKFLEEYRESGDKKVKL
jgi:hypothetical protein